MATLKTLCFVVCVGNINRMEAMVVKCGLMWAINYQVALIKTSHRANIKTETLSKILTLSTTVIRHFLIPSLMSVYMPFLNTKTEDL
jgi:hypothetical protein